MLSYEKLYEKFEQSPIHKTTEETAAAEAELATAIEELKSIVPQEFLFELDKKIGVLARAYEKQGFIFAQEVAKKCKRNGKR